MQMKLKPKILLNWDTSRKDLWEPFLKLKDDFEFIVIWGEKESHPFHPFAQIAWKDYATPYSLLDDVRPDKIVFFNINSFTQVGLNLAARNKGICTYVMHHAIYHSDMVERYRQIEKEGMSAPTKSGVNFRTMWFYLSALRIRNWRQVPNYLRFMWVRRRRERLLALKNCIFEGRLPTKYINLSPHNARLNMRVDGHKTDERFIFIGHPFYDSVLTDLNRLKSQGVSSDGAYFLLIDFPNKEQYAVFKRMGADRKIALYKRLSQIGKQCGCKLKIKLHPSEYDSSPLYEDDNIELIRETDTTLLIYQASKVFSFFSSLIVPVVYCKGRCYIFYTGDDRKFQDELVELGVGVKLDAFEFDLDDINRANNVEENGKGYEEFTRRYLFFADGKSTDRLRDVLSAEK